jgi:hypothetical protein
LAAPRSDSLPEATPHDLARLGLLDLRAVPHDLRAGASGEDAMTVPKDHAILTPTPTISADDLADLRAQLAQVTAERDALQQQLDALRFGIQALVDRWVTYDDEFHTGFVRECGSQLGALLTDPPATIQEKAHSV